MKDYPPSNHPHPRLNALNIYQASALPSRKIELLSKQIQRVPTSSLNAPPSAHCEFYLLFGLITYSVSSRQRQPVLAYSPPLRNAVLFKFSSVRRFTQNWFWFTSKFPSLQDLKPSIHSLGVVSPDPAAANDGSPDFLAPGVFFSQQPNVFPS